MMKEIPTLCAALALSAPMAISAEDGHGGAVAVTGMATTGTESEAVPWAVS